LTGVSRLLAYVHIFKTAGTTLTGLLRRNFSTRHFDTRVIQERPAITAAQLKRVLIFYPRLESIAGHAVRAHSDLKMGFPDIRYYTFLRDPVKRVISSFLFTGSNYIQRSGWRPRTMAEVEARLSRMSTNLGPYTRQLAPGGDVAAAIEVLETQIGFVGLVEHFDESLALFRNWIGRPDFDLRYRRLNVSEERTATERKFSMLRDEVTRFTGLAKELFARPDILAMIAEKRADEIAIFEHARSKIFPRQCERYNAGPGPFVFEHPDMPADTLVNRVYRDTVARYLVPLLAKPSPDAHGGASRRRGSY
jgi:hypothetical protein